MTMKGIQTLMISSRHMLLASLLLLFTRFERDMAAEPGRERGLALTFETLQSIPGERGADSRRARLVSLFVSEGAPPTPFLPPGRFRATWEGFLEIEFFDDYTFFARGNGTVALEIDGETVFAGLVESLPAEGKTVTLDEGQRPLVVHYESPFAGEAVLELSWASFDFAREPLSPSLLSHDPAHAGLRRGQLLRRGRELLATRSCLGCHASRVAREGGMPELEFRAPVLDGIGDRLRPEWLARWIHRPLAFRDFATMPRVFPAAPGDRRDGGDIDPGAVDIAAFLATLRAPAEPDSTIGDPGAGEALFRGLGCLGCHGIEGVATEELDEEDPEPISLTRIGEKWRRGALAAFLLDPRRHHPSGAMPAFDLDAAEARDLETFLLSVPAPSPPDVDLAGGDASRGREYLESSGCLGCHALEGVESTLHAPPLDAVLSSELDSGCLADSAGGRGDAPDFGWTDGDRRALRALLRDGVDSLWRQTPAEYAERRIEALRCIGCHIRDGELDLFSRATGSTSPVALPGGTPLPGSPPPVGGPGEAPTQLLQNRPTLTWTGEKYRPQWLGRFLDGEIDSRLRPWLEARMPVFSLDGDIMARGLAAQHALPPVAATGDVGQTASPAVVERLIALDGGFACRTCHDIGGDLAQGTFDAKGPDLLTVPERIRKEYFLRWMQNPQRIVRGTKMPQFVEEGRTAYTDVFEGDARRQFEAVWNYLVGRSASGGGETTTADGDRGR